MTWLKRARPSGPRERAGRPPGGQVPGKWGWCGGRGGGRGIFREGAKEVGTDSVARRDGRGQIGPSPLVFIQQGVAPWFKGSRRGW